MLPNPYRAIQLVPKLSMLPCLLIRWVAILAKDTPEYRAELGTNAIKHPSGLTWSLYKCGLRRGECLSVLSDDTDFLSVDARELHSFPEKCVFFVLVVRCERVLMDNDDILASTTGAGEIRQQALNLGNQSSISSLSRRSAIWASAMFRLPEM